MQFAGTVTINAPRLAVWALLMDHAVFVKISPGIQSITTIVPNERFVVTAGATISHQATVVKSEIIWDEVVEAEKLRWSSAIPFGTAAILTSGALLFRDDEGCVIEFSAEIRDLPRSLPPSLVHTIASRHIRKFFTNLKAEAEKSREWVVESE